MGSGSPVRGAEVAIEWGRGVGSGAATLRTDTAGHYAARRTLRTAESRCDGTVITVRAPYYASAYNAYSDSTCGPGGILTLDFKIIPLPR